MLAGDKQDIAKSKPVQMPRLGHHLVHRQRGAQDRGVAGKTAVFAIVHALVGDVERRE